MTEPTRYKPASERYQSGVTMEPWLDGRYVEFTEWERLRDALIEMQKPVNATGVPVQDCIDDAMDTWIRVVARTIFQSEKCNVVAMLPKAEVL